MKFYLLLNTFFLCNLCALLAQKPAIPIDEATKKTVYTEVVGEEGVPTADLYKRAENWFKTYYKNPGSVIEENDAANGKIAGQHSIYIFSDVDGLKHKEGMVKYRIAVLVKDGRYKYTIDDIFKLATPKVYIEEWLDENAVNKEVQFGYLRQVDTYIKELIESLKIAMHEPLGGDKEEEW